MIDACHLNYSLDILIACACSKEAGHKNVAKHGAHLSNHRQAELQEQLAITVRLREATASWGEEEDDEEEEEDTYRSEAPRRSARRMCEQSGMPVFTGNLLEQTITYEKIASLRSRQSTRYDTKSLPAAYELKCQPALFVL